MVSAEGDGQAVARHVRVHGHVQGVFFRDSTRRLARRHGVNGWVRNAVDGTVEAWLEGPTIGVDEVVAWMRSGGPRSAHVDRVDAKTAEPRGLNSFEVRY